MAKACPICKKPVVEAYRPFCSKGCKNIDLNRWLSGTYVIPSEDAHKEDTPHLEDEA